MADEPTESIVREIDIHARPETVFEFFIDADKLTRWLASEAKVDPRPGGECIQVHEGGDRRAGPFCMHGEFLEVDPPTRVVFTWGFTNPELGLPPGSSTVEVTLQPIASGTRVRLAHSGLPPAEIENHANGWTEMLGRLARAASAWASKPAGSNAADRRDSNPTDDNRPTQAPEEP